MTTSQGSKASLMEASRARARVSGHGSSKGAAGFISHLDEDQTSSFLSRPGETAIVNQPEGGLPDFEIGIHWDNVHLKGETSMFGRFFKKRIQHKGVDLDLGCLFRMKDGNAGAIQAFGGTYGAFDKPPYLRLSGDERTGDTEGEDEMIRLNGRHWEEIDQILVYTYIYSGAESFEDVKPQVQLRVPGEKPIVVSLHARRAELDICAVATIENIRGGIKLTTHLEYYPGHSEMDRAFGYGLEWEQGRK